MSLRQWGIRMSGATAPYDFGLGRFTSEEDIQRATKMVEKAYQQLELGDKEVD